MRAWPAKFDGLRLRLSAGWYSLPSYIGADERRLLIAVLSAGIAEVDHIVELDWEVLEEAADKLQLTRSLVFVRVPADVEPDGEALQRVRATLGSVRLGLLQYEAAGVWAKLTAEPVELLMMAEMVIRHRTLPSPTRANAAVCGCCDRGSRCRARARTGGLGLA